MPISCGSVSSCGRCCSHGWIRALVRKQRPDDALVPVVRSETQHGRVLRAEVRTVFGQKVSDILHIVAAHGVPQGQYGPPPVIGVGGGHHGGQHGAVCGGCEEIDARRGL
jgi:hypothetical protein